MATDAKPQKPYKGFPLTAHPNGRWCKKVRGRIHYFGRWDDWESALALYLDQRDDLHAGRKPRTVSDGPTLGDGLNQFLSSKKIALDAGEIGDRSYAEYVKTCDRISKAIRPETLIDDVDPGDLERLRGALARGKKGPLGPTSIKGDLTRARMVFLYINENLNGKTISYRKILKTPNRRLFRQLANERGERMFQREEIQSIVAAAPVQLKAMVLLGINCGFGNVDCSRLPFDKLDLDGAWHHFWRPKTHNARSCPLWPETVSALKDAIAARPKPRTKQADKLVFLTRFGRCWFQDDTGGNSITSEFRKLLQSLKMFRRNVTTFYSLRRTFETIGATAGEQVAVDYIMGHIAPTSDMSAVYRQKVFAKPLIKVANHVRAWYLGNLNIE